MNLILKNEKLNLLELIIIRMIVQENPINMPREIALAK